MAILPFDPTTLAPADCTLYDAMVAQRAARGAPFDGPYLALMNHPQLCKRIEDLGCYLKFDGHLAREVYQFVVMCVARHTDAVFEWDDHVAQARAAGVPEEVIDQLQRGDPGHWAFAPPYAPALQVLHCALEWRSIPQDVQQAAVAAFGIQGLIEIVVLSGFYQMFSAINCGFDVALPKGAAPAPFAGARG